MPSRFFFLSDDAGFRCFSLMRHWPAVLSLVTRAYAIFFFFSFLIFRRYFLTPAYAIDDAHITLIISRRRRRTLPLPDTLSFRRLFSFF